MCCQINNANYNGIGNIKILLSVKYPLEDSVINLISAIHFIIGERKIKLTKIGLRIVQKLNIIELSEIFYEKDNMSHYEINIQFNTVEYWIPTINKILFQNAYIVMEHILLDVNNDSLIKIFERSAFNNYFIYFNASFIENISYGDNFVQVDIIIHNPPIGLFIYLRKRGEVCAETFEFDSMLVTINNLVTEVQQKEILKFELGIYYIPQALGKNMDTF